MEEIFVLLKCRSMHGMIFAMRINGKVCFPKDCCAHRLCKLIYS